MEAYFGYDILFTMNITDIDDKIIVRARQKHLLTGYMENLESDNFDAIGKEALAWYLEHVMKIVAPEERKDILSMPDENVGTMGETLEKMIPPSPSADGESKFKHKNQVQSLARAIKVSRHEMTRDSFLESFSDILSLKLDAELGHTVSDPSVSRKLASYWENDFFSDMDRLGVVKEDPDKCVAAFIFSIWHI